MPLRVRVKLSQLLLQVTSWVKEKLVNPKRECCFPLEGNLGNVSEGSSGGTSLEPPNTTTSEGALLGALRRLVERSGKTTEKVCWTV